MRSTKKPAEFPIWPSAFARMEFVKRSKGKNAVCKAAYIERCTLEFEGTKFQAPEVYSWAKLEKPFFSKVYLPDHVDPSFKDIKTLWNAVEKFEKRKDSQVGLEIVLALPDDKSISLEDKICLIERFISKNARQSNLRQPRQAGRKKANE